MFLGVHGKANNSGSHLLSMLLCLHCQTDSTRGNFLCTPFCHLKVVNVRMIDRNNVCEAFKFDNLALTCSACF